MLIWFCLFGIVYTGGGLVCSQCDSDTDPDCLMDPPPPQNCTSCSFYSGGLCTRYVHMNYCIIERRFINSTLIRITRDCSPALMRDKCDYKRDRDQTIKVCFYTCGESGCNMSAAGVTMTSLQNCVVMATALLFSTNWYRRRNMLCI